MTEEKKPTVINPYLVLALLGAAMLLTPLLTIVAIRTLSGADLPIDIATWGAAFWVNLLIYGRGR